MGAMSALPSFPITPLLPEIRASLAAHPRLVLEAPPGAGKTTQVPLALLGEDWLGDGKILMLEPRRIAARAAAKRWATRSVTAYASKRKWARRRASRW
jgi:ATP-dependent helicase HrpB